MCNFTTGCRPPLNIQMLAKMRLVMVEKWYERYKNQLRVLHAPCARRALLSTRVLTLVDRAAAHSCHHCMHGREGHCYDECMRNASKGMPCFPSCNVERDMINTLGQAKALNPNVRTAHAHACLPERETKCTRACVHAPNRCRALTNHSLHSTPLHASSH